MEKSSERGGGIKNVKWCGGPVSKVEHGCPT